jgi:MFS family permease
VGIELGKLRRGQVPLLDLRRFGDRTFTFSNVANVCVAVARFGIGFLLPIYLQTLRGLSAAQAGLILATPAVATMVILPFVGRSSDRLGPRPVAITGLAMTVVTVLLMLRLALGTPVGLIVALLALMGCAFAFLTQITVTAMSRIEKTEAQEIANGSTLISVLHATAAPMGVALVSSVVQTRSLAHTAELAAAGMNAALAEMQGALQAMHDSFLIAAVLVVLALIAMFFVPKRRLKTAVVEEAQGLGGAEVTIVEGRAT